MELEPETQDGVLTGVGHMGAKASATARAATARSTERILDVRLEAARLVCSRMWPVKIEIMWGYAHRDTKCEYKL